MSKKTSEEQKEDQKEQKEKKKRGFLGYLWLLFLVFLLLLSMATGFFYWQTHLVTGYALELYAKRLADVMTSPEYYQPGKEEKQEEALKQKRDSILSSFTTFAEAYKKLPNKEWQETFSELQSQIVKIFEDHKVLPAELDEFVGKVKATTEILEKEIEINTLKELEEAKKKKSS